VYISQIPYIVLGHQVTQPQMKDDKIDDEMHAMVDEGSSYVPYIELGG